MSKLIALTSAAAVAGLLSLYANAATTDTALIEVKPADLPEIAIERDIRQLEPVLRPAPNPDPDSTDTALVFHNPRGWLAVVRCVGFNHNGVPVGRIALRVPRNGVRLAFASDLAHDRDFIGSVSCTSSARVVPTAFIVGNGLTDTKAQVIQDWSNHRIRFPLVAAF